MLIKNIVKDNIKAKADSKIYGISKYFFLLSSKLVSSYRNSVEIKVPRHEIKPRKVFFKPKNSNVKLWLNK